jgi:alanine dehydrogenase
MVIGIPKEIKIGETRVSITPDICRQVISQGSKILIEKKAGEKAGFSDKEFEEAGARVVPSARQVYESATLILKVKEPLKEEFSRLQKGQALFTYLHLAANKDLGRCLLEKGILAIAYENVESRNGEFPLLKPMSQIAGRLSVQIGAHFLQSQNGGAGVLLGGIPGTRSGRVVVVGAGNAGAHACRIAMGMGSEVTVLDIDERKLNELENLYEGKIATLMASPSNLREAVSSADLLIGAVLIPGAKAPCVVSKEMVAAMRPGSVVVDIAVDQGGCIETIHPTSHTEPIYRKSKVLHYAVPNMPALVARTSTLALAQATEPYIVELAKKGLSKAIEEAPGLSKGLNMRNGRAVHPQIAQIFGN